MKFKSTIIGLIATIFIISACSTGTPNTGKKGDAMVKEEAIPAAFVGASVSSKSIPPSNSQFPDNPNLGLEFDMNALDEIWLAGGCFWGVEAYMSRVYGVYDVTSGYANGSTMEPTYKDVLAGSGHTEAVHVTYDPSKVSLEVLLTYFFKVVDPTSLNKQGNDIGANYRSGIYYEKDTDLEVINRVLEKEQLRYSKTIVTEVLPLEGYYLAEEYHQDYLEKNPNGYCHINFDELDSDVMVNDVPKDDTMAPVAYERPSNEEIKAMLTDLQYKVTQQEGTEPAFDNLYVDNHEDGIYVDVVTGEPLFSSSTKYESGTGWPSFYEPISNDVLTLKEDNSLFTKRVEVRSAIGDSHLGHVFTDGPKEHGGLRYCLNSASLNFIPYDEMESEGYGYLMSVVK